MARNVFLYLVLCSLLFISIAYSARTEKSSSESDDDDSDYEDINNKTNNSGTSPYKTYNIETQNFSQDPIFRFILLENATVSISVDSIVQDTPLVLTICEFDKWKYIYAKHNDKTLFCEILKDLEKLSSGEGMTFASDDDEDDYVFRANRCEKQITFQDSLTLRYQVKRYGKYYINLSNCNIKTTNGSVNATVRIQAENPDFLHSDKINLLSAELMPLPIVYMIMTVIWSCLIPIWIRLYWVNRKSPFFLTLHFLFLPYICIKILTTVYNYYYFTYASYSTLLPIQKFLFRFFDTIFKSYYIFILLLFSNGWLIFNTRLKNEKYNIFAILFGYTSILVFQNSFGGQDTLAYLMLQLLGLGSKVFIFSYMMITINSYLEPMSYRVLNYRPSNTNYTAEQIVQMIKKFRLFLDFKRFLSAWIGICVYEFLISFLYYEGAIENWISMTDSEFLDFILFVGVFYLYRPRTLSSAINVFNPVNYPPIGEEQSQQEGSNNNNNDANNNEEEDEEDIDHNNSSTPLVNNRSFSGDIEMNIL
ncbi:hypothetical protein CYY_001020 [Polysphondylium violaceum]|uniref:Intimal thickness related receptor IRP domain-containing protein n=1 Tax=Polysphondylium violaceum TaxID=133409 RepID=A0A8J4PYU9_9MYCE|nr:hypothetical protein CYY_001020 [Polysphondylium violaceum]